MTPPASWRPWQGFVLGPATCIACRAGVWFGRSMTRLQGVPVLGEVRAWRDWGAYQIHRCAAKAAA